MSYEDEVSASDISRCAPIVDFIQDLIAAIGHTKHGNHVASQHRKAASFTSRLAGWVSTSSEVSRIKSMTPVERHAELIYAETLFEKVCDWRRLLLPDLSMIYHLFFLVGSIGYNLLR